VFVKSKISHAVKTINQDKKKPKTIGITLRFTEHNVRCVMQPLQKKYFNNIKSIQCSIFFLVSYDTKLEVILQNFTIPRTTLLEPLVYNVQRGLVYSFRIACPAIFVVPMFTI